MNYENNKIFDLGMSLYTNDNITVIKDNYSTNVDPTQIDLLKKKKFKQSFIDVILQVNNCSFEWEDANGLNENNYNVGKSSILPIDKICSNWKLFNKD